MDKYEVGVAEALHACLHMSQTNKAAGDDRGD
jgi:hypothetical protein